MYKAYTYIDGVKTCFYDDTVGGETVSLISPTLTRSDSNAGSFEFTLPPTNVAFSHLERFSSRVIIEEEGVEIWEGRPISEDKDFYKRRKITCEGELAYLNDTIQPPNLYSASTVLNYLKNIIAVHNAAVMPTQEVSIKSLTRIYTLSDRFTSVSKITYIKDSETVQLTVPFTFDASTHKLTFTTYPRVTATCTVYGGDTSKMFTVGDCTVTDPNQTSTYPISYNTTMELVNNLLKTFEGHMRVRKPAPFSETSTYAVGTSPANYVTYNDQQYRCTTAVTTAGAWNASNWTLDPVGRFLDYYDDYPTTSEQTITFGTNLLDFTEEYDVSELCTAIIPLGASLEEDDQKYSDRSDIHEYLTVASVNDGSIYVVDQDAVDEFGWIEKTVQWSEIESASELLKKAQAYLEDEQYDEVSMTVKALDMHYVSSSNDTIKLLDKVKCVSSPHGISKYFPCTKIVIKMDNPGNNEYTLGKKEKTFTSTNSETDAELVQKISVTPQESKILVQAKESATNIINASTTGYVTMKKNSAGTAVDELLITDTPNYLEATKVWRWNINGFGYSSTGYSGTYGTAITMDGAIVADFITTGTMSADRIKGGTLTMGGPEFSYDGKIVMLNEDGDEYGSWDENGLRIGEEFSVEYDEGEVGEGDLLATIGGFKFYRSEASDARYLALLDETVGMGEHSQYRLWAGSNKDNPQFQVDSTGRVICSNLQDTAFVGGYVLYSDASNKYIRESSVTIEQLLTSKKPSYVNVAASTLTFSVTYTDSTTDNFAYTVDSTGNITSITKAS